MKAILPKPFDSYVAFSLRICINCLTAVNEFNETWKSSQLSILFSAVNLSVHIICESSCFWVLDFLLLI
jgi:hypothetical protein